MSIIIFRVATIWRKSTWPKPFVSLQFGYYTDSNSCPAYIQSASHIFFLTTRVYLVVNLFGGIQINSTWGIDLIKTKFV